MKRKDNKGKKEWKLKEWRKIEEDLKRKDNKGKKDWKVKE